jgi:NADH dehydrogenase FAD-containing subunit
MLKPRRHTELALAWDGQLAPGLAPAAKQGGAYVATLLRARLRNRKPPPLFRYRHLLCCQLQSES